MLLEDVGVVADRIGPQVGLLLPKLLQPFAVDLHSHGAGLRQRVVLEDEAHVMKQPSR